MSKLSSTTTDNAGSFCERGIINSFDRQGFTLVKCGSELIANSIDAGSTNIIFSIVREDWIKIIDDGCGMTFEQLKKMVKIYGENHANHKSMGVSGMGFSAASLQWSKAKDRTPKIVCVYTKNQNGQYLKACIPWDKICLEGKYTGQIEISEMTINERNEFVLERTSNKLRSVGTTIIIPHSENVIELLDEQFLKEKKYFENLKDSWSIVFGKNYQRITYNDGIDYYELPKYDYFGGSDEEFYCGKFYTSIYSFMDDQGNYRFVCKNPYDSKPNRIYMEFKKIGKGFSTKVEEVEVSSEKINESNIINFVSGMRKCNEIFDENNPKEVSAKHYMNDYDEQFSINNDDYKKFCGQISIFRNNQRITGFTPEGYNINNSRADGKQKIKYSYHRVSLSYETESKQNNSIDEIHGIQQNKNQNQNDFPKNYQRLVKYLKEYHSTEIQNYIDSLIPKINQHQPEINQHQPELNQSQSKINQPQPEIIQSQPEIIQSQPEIIKNEPEIIKHEPEINQSQPEIIKHEPEINQHKPEINQPQPEIRQHKSEIFQPQSEIRQHKSEIFQLNPKTPIKSQIKINQCNSKIHQTEINQSQPEVNQNNTEYKDESKKIEESRIWLKNITKLIMETYADPNYKGTNGKEIYNLIQCELNK